MSSEETCLSDMPTAEIKSELPPFVVGIGTSAGGLDALEKFFRNMRPDSGLGFILIQHLSPDYKSMMVELLSKYTAMTVKHVEDGMPVGPDTVYLMPPGTSLTIFHGKLYLAERSTLPHVPNLPIDLFFRSLAKDMAHRAVCIVLSGTGTDGTLGSRAVKEAGGMVMVQDPSTAQFDGMPRSAIHNGLADYILSPEEMPEELLQYVQHPCSGSPENRQPSVQEEGTLSKILNILRLETGVDFSYYRPATIIRRIERRIGVNRIDSLESYLAYLSRNRAEVHSLYNELLIGVTRFFRDSEAFKIVRDKVIPEVLRRDEKQDKNPFRIWVSGCSTGEEVYSLAILFCEHLENLAGSPEVKIFATDIDKRAIEMAGTGRYPASIVSDVPMNLLNKYFFKRDDDYQVVEKIRKMVIFAQHNLLKDPPFNRLDMISCRNLLIYFQPDIQKKVMSMFGFSLNLNGFLFLGSSESVGDLRELFSVFESKWKIFRYKGGAVYTGFHVFDSARLARKTMPKPPMLMGGELPRTRMIENIQSDLVSRYVPPSIIVNASLDLLHIIGDVNDYLHLPQGSVNYNLMNMAHDNIAMIVSSGVRRVRQNKEAVTYKNVVFPHKDGEQSAIITIAPHVEGPWDPEYFIVSFISHHPSEISPDTSHFHPDEHSETRIRELERELQLTQENLQATIEELETSNEELQATNEELMSANEELQSTNEELQSVNEELYTVNAEYQNKIEELTALNNDMNNFLSSSNIGTIFLDRDLRIRKFTPTVKEYFPIMEHDVGRPIQHLTHKLEYSSLIADVEKVLRTLIPIEHDVRMGRGKWYRTQIMPYRTQENTINGVILSFVDITQVRESEAKYHQLLENLIEGIWSIDKEFCITYVNPVMSDMLGYSESDMRRKHLFSFMDERGIECCKKYLEHHQLEIREYQGVELTRKDGNLIYVNMKVSPITDPEGNYMGSIAAVKNVTEHILTDRALEQKGAMLKHIVDLIPPQLFAKTGDGKFRLSEFAENLEELEAAVNQLKEKLS